MALAPDGVIGPAPAVVNSGGGARAGDGYRPLNKELQRMSNGDLAKFSLEDEEEIKGGDVAVPATRAAPLEQRHHVRPALPRDWVDLEAHAQQPP